MGLITHISLRHTQRVAYALTGHGCLSDTKRLTLRLPTHVGLATPGMGRFLSQFDRPVDFPNQSLPHVPLTFEVVDDLVGAHVRGRLTSTPQVRYAAREIGPLIELMMEASNGRIGPLLRTTWLDPVTQVDLRTALTTPQNVWLDGPRRRGFMRTTFDPRN